MGVLLPSKKGERKLIGFPQVLPMGWAESSPAFCAGTETIADLANAILATNIQSLGVCHRLDALSETALALVTSKPIIHPADDDNGIINLPSLIAGSDLFPRSNQVMDPRMTSPL